MHNIVCDSLILLVVTYTWLYATVIACHRMCIPVSLLHCHLLYTLSKQTDWRMMYAGYIIHAALIHVGRLLGTDAAMCCSWLILMMLHNLLFAAVATASSVSKFIIEYSLSCQAAGCRRPVLLII